MSSSRIYLTLSMVVYKMITIVLRHENEYNQHGGYFVGAFDVPPVSPNGHWGRQGVESTWYTKVNVLMNRTYHEESEIHDAYEDTK